MVKDEYFVGDEQIGLRNNAVFIYDFATGKQTLFRGTDVLQFLPVLLPEGYKLLLLFGTVYRGFHIGELDDSGKLFGTTLKKLWRSPRSDLGYSTYDKIVRQLFITTSGAVDLIVRGDKTSTFRPGGSAYSQIVPVRKKGHEIGLEIRSDNNFVLTDVTLELDLIRRDPTAKL